MSIIEIVFFVYSKITPGNRIFLCNFAVNLAVHPSAFLFQYCLKYSFFPGGAPWMKPILSIQYESHRECMYVSIETPQIYEAWREVSREEQLKSC